MIGKLVDVKIDEAKQYSLNGTFVENIKVRWWFNSMYSKEDILKHADTLANRINNLEIVKDYQTIEKQIHNNKTIENKMKNLKKQQNNPLIFKIMVKITHFSNQRIKFIILKMKLINCQ